jgi:hypothetical protein
LLALTHARSLAQIEVAAAKILDVQNCTAPLQLAAAAAAANTAAQTTAEAATAARLEAFEAKVHCRRQRPQ